MEEEIKRKKVFISYRWTNPNHEEWVLNLAKRLVDDNVDVVLDKWNLKQGQDKYAFMESMVQDATIDKVLIICEKGYKEKADSREGGVGTETQIITPELYEKTLQTRYIPIVAEEGENDFSKYMPQYIKSRIAIKMSTPESYIQGYEELLRVIYDKPQHEKPKFGKTPSFITDEVKTTSKLYFLNKSLSKYIEENREGMIERTIYDFKDVFFNELDSFLIMSIKDLKEPYNQQLLSYIDEMKGIRDEYISFLENLICGYKGFSGDVVIEIFEILYKYTEYQGHESYKECMMEHYKFFMTELFIWTNIILFKYKKYNEMKDILHTTYFVESKSGQIKQHFSQLRTWLDYIEASQNTNPKRLSIMADKLIERADYKNKNYKNEIIEMDIFLSYISKINCNSDWYEEWFPVTYIYKNQYSKMNIIQKLERNKYFEEIKILFNVDNKEEMKQLIREKLSKVERGYNNSFSHIPIIADSIDINDIGKY